MLIFIVSDVAKQPRLKGSYYIFHSIFDTMFICVGNTFLALKVHSFRENLA